MKHINTILVAAENYKKHRGERPEFLILSDAWATAFFSELYEFVMTADGEKFENPVGGHCQFRGITVVVVKEVYGFGEGFNFALGE